jgi:predicted nuclease of predicted toxin-antitoxin system
LVTALAELGHDVDSVPQEGLTGEADPDVWIGAQRSGRFLITQDLDFSEVTRYAPGLLGLLRRPNLLFSVCRNGFFGRLLPMSGIPAMSSLSGK